MSAAGDRVLAKNVALNFAGQVVPLAAALVAIPILVNALGPARFGILTLVWAAVGYFGLFDFGIGRALTHSIATRLGTDATEEIASVTWTGLLLLLVFGTLGGVALALATPQLIDHFLNVPPELRAEAKQAFYLMAVSLPFALFATGLRGVLEAFQDFRTATALRVPVGVLMYIAPVAVLPLSHGLGALVLTLFLVRLASSGLHLGVCLQRYPQLRHNARWRSDLISPLLRYGGWMTVSNVVSPIMVNLDRFMIGALLPIVSVAYYVTPYELVTKLFLIPTAVLGVVFPALATAVATDRARAVMLIDRSVRVILLAVFPITLVMVTLAHEGLRLWVGPSFAQEGAPVLRWLAVGVLINCTAGQVAYTALQGAGRPDLTAKTHLVELPIYLATTWFLVHELGLVGVAVAWTLRVTADAIVLFGLTIRGMREARKPALATARTLAFMVIALVVAALLPTTSVRVVALGAGLTAFGAVAWSSLLRPAERVAVIAWMRAVFGGGPSLKTIPRD